MRSQHGWSWVHEIRRRCRQPPSQTPPAPPPGNRPAAPKLSRVPTRCTNRARVRRQPHSQTPPTSPPGNRPAAPKLSRVPTRCTNRALVRRHPARTPQTCHYVSTAHSAPMRLIHFEIRGLGAPLPPSRGSRILPWRGLGRAPIAGVQRARDRALWRGPGHAGPCARGAHSPQILVKRAGSAHKK